MRRATAPGCPVPEALVALALPPVDVFRVFFHTADLRPNHRVTARNAVDGLNRDVYGTYRDGAWVFEFERHLDSATVQFPQAPPRPLLGYDNLRTEEGVGQQERLRANHLTGPDYDVVIIGSGFGGGVLADALSDRGHRVLVLDAGGLIYPSHITNLPGDWPALPSYHQVGNFVSSGSSARIRSTRAGGCTSATRAPLITPAARCG